MSLVTARRMLRKGLFASVVATIAAGAGSCDSMIYDKEGDCAVHYRMNFRYTANMLNTDAFGSQVTIINLALYDKDGKMAFRTRREREKSQTNDYYIDLDVAPGTYDIIAWCEGDALIKDALSFTLTGQEDNAGINSSGATLQLQGNDNGLFSCNDIRPLYYGCLRDVEFPDTYGVVEIPPVPLTKDTNHILIQLQNMDGLPLDPSILSFELEGFNSELDWQNSLKGNLHFWYKPWSVTSSFTPVGEKDPDTRGSLADSELPSGVQAEITTGRILADKEQYLVIRNLNDGKRILRIPLVEYLLLVRGKYTLGNTAQDYLDIYDDYSLVFFIDENYTWLKSRILINGWRVVPPQSEKV